MNAPTSPRRDAYDVVVKWLVPHRVIYIGAAGDISPSVREWMNTQALYLYHSCATPQIHLLINMEKVTSQSPASRQDRPAIWHQRRGWCITVGTMHNPLLRGLINPLLRLFRTYIQDLPSNEDGLAFLQKADPSLPDLQPYWEAIKRHQGQ
jgi:hypothetical protein